MSTVTQIIFRQSQLVVLPDDDLTAGGIFATIPASNRAHMAVGGHNERGKVY